MERTTRRQRKHGLRGLLPTLRRIYISNFKTVFGAKLNLPTCENWWALLSFNYFPLHRLKSIFLQYNQLLQKWDESLSDMALAWAKECNWELGQPENISPYPELGQNLHFYATVPDPVNKRGYSNIITTFIQGRKRFD